MEMLLTLLVFMVNNIAAIMNAGAFITVEPILIELNIFGNTLGVGTPNLENARSTIQNAPTKQAYQKQIWGFIKR